jgi:hypothetical protein
LPQCVRMHFEPGDAGTMSWNAQKFNMHNVAAIAVQCFANRNEAGISEQPRANDSMAVGRT